MYRLIATDVDGTLLDRDSRITGLNRDALLKCREKKIEVILATGKTMDSIIDLVKDLDLKLPQITLNGSITISPELEVINTCRINPDIYSELVSFIKRSGCPLVVALDNGKLYAEEIHPDLRYINEIGEEYNIVKSIDTDRFAKNTVDIYVPIPQSHPLEKALRKKYSDRLQFIRSGDYFFDILNKGATKGSALVSIIKGLGIRPEEVVVFGDSPNDLSMFEVAGLKIAVRNSYPEVLDKADIITDVNYDSGLGKAVYKYILKDT